MTTLGTALAQGTASTQDTATAKSDSVPAPAATIRPVSDDDVLDALAAWCQAENAEFLAARASAQASYMQAICDEVDVMTAYALARSCGAPQDELREVRELLAQVTAKREAAARELGLDGVLPDAVRACAELLTTGPVPVAAG